VYRARVPPPPNVAAELLREHVARDAPAREASVAKFMAGVCGLSAVSSLVLLPIIGTQLAFSLAIMLLVLTGYYFALIRLIGGGWFHPAVSWVNVAIEVSAPSLIFLIDVNQGGVEYALTAPPIIIWGTLIALSGLRGNKWLTVGAGALAALEYTLLYALVAMPKLETTLVTLRPPLFATRVVLLFSSAVLTAIFVNHLNRRAEEALSAVRAKDVFGKYLLHERLGMGGMAEVYRATYNPEGGFQKVVALKRVLPQFAEDEAFISMFREEAALCSQFSHPGVVQVFDFGRFGDSYFLAMEYLDGPPLGRVLRAHRGIGLPVPAVLHLAISLCEALQYVHERRGPAGEDLRLVHRDLNPPNVLLSKLGEVKLTDFGIARSTSHIQHTEVGTIKGKPGYLAPEQAQGDDFDARVDLFALGVTLWECLVGEPLFSAPDAATTLANVFEKQVPAIRSKRPEVPVAFEAFVMQLLQREPTRRTPSARVALQSLRAMDSGAVGGGARSLASAIETTLRTTQPSSAGLKPAVATPAEAVTLPGRG
jgi:eukaryotic-like serine/threonine-protein kinase